MCPCHAVCLSFSCSCCCCRFCYYTQSRYSCYYCCCWRRLLFLRSPLFHFFPCHAVAFLAAPVVAKPAETSVKYPAFPDPPDHTEILQIIQILQIVQTASRLICTDHSDHTDPTQVHTCEISASYRPIPAKHDVNKCEVSRFYRSSILYKNPADRTDPADHADPR